MHLLIHSYARKIGQSRLADLLAKGEKLVLFISCLALRTRPNCTGEEAVAKNPFLLSKGKEQFRAFSLHLLQRKGGKENYGTLSNSVFTQRITLSSLKSCWKNLTQMFSQYML